jgi:hypothetical protein
VAGLLYWYGIYPLHALVFRGMMKGIIRSVTDGKNDLKRAIAIAGLSPNRDFGRFVVGEGPR